MNDGDGFKKKLVFLGLVCLPGLALVFLYVAGALFLKDMKLPLSQLRWSTYAEVGWALSSSDAAYATWVKAGQMAGLGVCLLVCVRACVCAVCVFVLGSYCTSEHNCIPNSLLFSIR